MLSLGHCDSHAEKYIRDHVLIWIHPFQHKHRGHSPWRTGLAPLLPRYSIGNRSRLLEVITIVPFQTIRRHEIFLSMKFFHILQADSNIASEIEDISKLVNRTIMPMINIFSNLASALKLRTADGWTDHDLL